MLSTKLALIALAVAAGLTAGLPTSADYLSVPDNEFIEAPPVPVHLASRMIHQPNQLVQEPGAQKNIEKGKIINPTVLAASLPAGDMDPDMKEAFQVFDMHGNGVISASELRGIMTNPNLGKMTDEEADKRLHEEHLDGHGQISYKEFVKVMSAPKN